MSLVTLVFLFACHEAATYMVLQYHFIIVMLYGIILLTLDIYLWVVDLGNSRDDAKAVYEKLSQNQKDYFDQNVSKL